MKNDAEFQQKLKQFHEEASKLENSESLKKARKKFEQIESESRNFMTSFKSQLSDIYNELNKKNQELINSKVVSDSIKKVSNTASSISKKLPIDKISEGARSLNETMKSESESLKYSVYKSPSSFSIFKN